MKGLRGTRLDPFGLPRSAGSSGRCRTSTARWWRARLERLTPVTHGTVAEIAELPDVVRGYEDIKLANVERFRAAAGSWRSGWRGACRRAGSSCRWRGGRARAAGACGAQFAALVELCRVVCRHRGERAGWSLGALARRPRARLERVGLLSADRVAGSAGPTSGSWPRARRIGHTTMRPSPRIAGRGSSGVPQRDTRRPGSPAPTPADARRGSESPTPLALLGADRPRHKARAAPRTGRHERQRHPQPRRKLSRACARLSATRLSGSTAAAPRAAPRRPARRAAPPPPGRRRPR